MSIKDYKLHSITKIEEENLDFIYEKIKNLGLDNTQNPIDFYKGGFDNYEVNRLFDILAQKAARFENQTAEIFQWVRGYLAPQSMNGFLKIFAPRNKLNESSLGAKEIVYHRLLKEKVKQSRMSVTDLIYENFLKSFNSEFFEPGVYGGGVYSTGFDAIKKLKEKQAPKLNPAHIDRYIEPLLDYYQLSPMASLDLLSCLQEDKYMDGGVLERAFFSLSAKGLNFKQPIYGWNFEPYMPLGYLAMIETCPKAIDFFIEQGLNWVKVKVESDAQSVIIEVIQDKNKIRKALLKRIATDMDWFESDIAQLTTLFEKRVLSEKTALSLFPKSITRKQKI